MLRDVTFCFFFLTLLLLSSQQLTNPFVILQILFILMLAAVTLLTYLY